LGKRNSGIDCEKCGSGIKNGKCSTSGDETYKGKMNRLVSNRKSIEYDGEHHYNSNTIWGGDEFLNKMIIHDKIKNDYCNFNKIKLFRISYKDKGKIENKLNEYFQLNNFAI